MGGGALEGGKWWVREKRKRTRRECIAEEGGGGCWADGRCSRWLPGKNYLEEEDKEEIHKEGKEKERQIRGKGAKVIEEEGGGGRGQ